jgi:hypothetical protein
MNDTETFFYFENALLTELHATRARSGGQAAGHVAVDTPHR